jgi:hypothetical protein
MAAQPIFIVGSERSGSNLLRTLLGNHSMVSAPVDPHFFDAWYGLLSAYADLRVPANMRLLLADMLEYANHPFNDWRLRMDLDEALADAPQSFLAAFDRLCRAKAAQEGRTAYVCKGNHLFDHAFKILAHWPEARLLYLYRDPRDHCASWKEKPLHLLTVHDAVAKWEREQRACLQLVRFHGVRMHFVRYEELIAEPARTMDGVLRHCGLPVEEACFRTDAQRARSEAERYVYWRNIDKPIDAGNSGRYREKLTEEELRMVETLAAPMMRSLGYEPVTQGGWRPPALWPLRLQWMRQQARRRHREHLVKGLALLHDKNAALRRIQQRARARRLT